MTTVEVTITRSLLGLSDLHLSGGLASSAFDVISLDMGEVGWQDQIVKSPYVAGAYEVGAAQDDVDDCSAVVRIKGTSHTHLQLQGSRLVSAFKQKEYTLTVELDGEEYAWLCRRARYRMGFDVPTRRSCFARYTFSFARHPVPVAGPY